MKSLFKNWKINKIDLKIDSQNKQILDSQGNLIFMCNIEGFPIISATSESEVEILNQFIALFNQLNHQFQIISYDDVLFNNHQAIEIKKFLFITKSNDDLKKILNQRIGTQLNFEDQLVVLSKYFNNIKNCFIQKQADGVVVDGKKWNFLLANEFLLEQQLAFMARFIYRYECNYSLKVEYLPIDRLLHSKLNHSLQVCDDPVELEKYQLLINALNHNEKIIKLTYQLAFDNQKIKNIYHAMDNALVTGIKYRKNYFRAEQSFYQQLPINSMMLKDNIKYSNASMISYAFPFYSEKLIDLKPNILIGYTLNTHEAIIYNNFSLTRNRMNANELLLGSSGCGKTTLLMKLIYFRNQQNFYQYIVDVEGKQLKNLTKALGGLVVDGSKLIINPLQIRNLSAKNPFMEHMQFLRSFLQSYNNQTFISDWHYNYLEQSLEQVYQKFGITAKSTVDVLKRFKADEYPLLKDVYDWIEKDYRQNPNNSKYQECLNFLYPLTHGIDAVLFNQYTNFTFDKELVCFDLSAFESNSEQKNLKCQYFNVLSFIWDNITSKAVSTHSQVYFDEFNVLLDPRFTDGIAYIKNISKRIRKYNAGITCATQQVEDLFNNDEHQIGSSILGNSCNQFIFKIDDLQNNILKQLHNDELVYFVQSANRGQCLLKIGNHYQVPITINIEDNLLEIFRKCE